MTDEIRKVIADEIGIFDDATSRVIAGDHRTADRIIAALHAAGYEIVPRWSTDLDAAPGDGTKVDLLYPYPRGRTTDCYWLGKDGFG